MSRPLDDLGLRLQAVLDNATVSIFLMDDRQRCIYMNRAAERLTGYTLSEVIALNRPLHDIIHHTYPDGRPFPLHECAIDRAFPEHAQTQGEEVFVHADGSFYPVAFTASPIRDEQSKTIGTIIEVRDISKEKEAQQRQRLLMHELNHRVKNTLATVQATARQTLKGAEPSLMAKFEGRLSALTRTHDLLTRASWEKANLTDIAAAALSSFDQSRIDIRGEPCDVHPKAAVSLSMAFYELGVNAVKYGALSGESGRVSLRWTCKSSDGGADIEIDWREEGGPKVSPPAAGGFGTRLIEKQLPMEFGGETRLEFKAEGLACNIRIRAPQAGPPLDPDRV